MNEHYFTEVPRAKYKEYKIDTIIRGIPFTFFTASGMFSPRKIDPGTRLLAENMVLRKNSKVLDVGCGYGVLAIVAAKVCKTCKVYGVEINKRALSLAVRNAKINEVKVEFRQGNLYRPFGKEKFDIIISNPPFTAGMNVCERIVKDGYEHLNENGLLQIVGRQRKGGKHLSNFIKEVFGGVEVIARKSGYRVWLAVRPPVANH